MAALPPLGAARCIEITFRTESSVDWLSCALASIAHSYPLHLEEIRVTYYVEGRLFRPPYFRPDTMAALNKGLSTFTALPRIRWRLYFEPADDGHHAEYFAEFSKFMQLGLPAIHEGKLILERYFLAGETGEWAVR